MKSLSNGIISISVKEHGAELCSLKYEGREYLWQADPEFWARHSPVLFPIVGSVWNKQYRCSDRIFNMGQHGIARDMDFEFVSRTDDEIWYRLCSNEQTLQKYPYHFVLEIGYRISGKTVQVMWRVTNPSKEETLHFQIGAHPAFHWPLLTTGAIEAGTSAMKEELTSSAERGFFKLEPAASKLVKSVIGAAGCFDPALTCEQELDADSCVAINTSSFDSDALVFENSQVNAVTLCARDKTPYLTLRFPDAPVVGLWSSPGKNAPFVCIEPWYGRADSVNYEGEYSQKPWINSLAPLQTFNGGYTIEIE